MCGKSLLYYKYDFVRHLVLLETKEFSVETKFRHFLTIRTMLRGISCYVVIKFFLHRKIGGILYGYQFCTCIVFICGKRRT